MQRTKVLPHATPAGDPLLTAALASMPYGFSIWGEDRRLILFNQHYLDMYRFPSERVWTGMSLLDICKLTIELGNHPGMTVEALHETYLQRLDQCRDPATPLRSEKPIRGRVVKTTHICRPGLGWVVTHEDITEEVERQWMAELREKSLAVQNVRFKAAVDNMRQGLCMFDREERLVICNQTYAEIYDLPPELVQTGARHADIVSYRIEHGMRPVGGVESFMAQHWQLRQGEEAAVVLVELANGKLISIRHQPMADGGWVATHQDVTEQHRQEERIRHLARHDALTDLPNRVMLREEMEKLGARIERDEMVAVLCLDLDHFKAVNDTLGHVAGDEVLVNVGRRLREACRGDDVVARLGGDEFAVLVQALENPLEAAAVADRIVRSVAEPMVADGHQVMIGTSIGIAMAPGDGHDAETLLRNADTALYRAKSDGRGNYHFFEKGMDEALQHRRMLEQGLKVALARGEFRLVYQPLMDLDKNRISCLEALLRWDHPERGLIEPMEFIPVAEETGVITSIGEWVLRTACKAAAAWPEHVRIAVNLSPAQFRHRGLVDQVISAVREAGLAPSRLELEVTESLLLADTDQTLDTLHRLRDLGVRIAMDDFGTGYSSLSYLRSFPFDKIKIDRSFMQGLAARENSLAIIKAVIGLGRSLGMSTTAEGIETEEQLAAIREQGCDEAQGFLIAAPLSVGGVDALLGRAAADNRFLRTKR